jgi:hypothetical protein
MPAVPTLFSRRLFFWFAALTAGSIASRQHVRGAAAGCCSFDGAPIAAVHRVDLMEGETVRASFCSFACARSFRERPADAWWQVRDEISGEPLDARRAFFVQSRVVSVPAAHERIHVFRDVTEALNHCAQFGGARIANPLAAPAVGLNEKGR